MSGLLRAMENEVQILALIFMASVYVLRLVWIFRFLPRRERTLPAGGAGAGIRYSMMNIAMPWAMESTRQRPLFYVQFVIFHLGVLAAISATFLIPYLPSVFGAAAVAAAFEIVIGAAFLVGILRLVRRLTNPAIRLISTADDYLSLVLLILYFGAGVLALSNLEGTREWPLLLFFGLTAFLLVYVPFSKICHYLYYPFTRYYLGRVLGHRGAIPPRKPSQGRGQGKPGDAPTGRRP